MHPAHTHESQPPVSHCVLGFGSTACSGAGDFHCAGRGRFHNVCFGDESNGPLAVEHHDLFDAVPVGFG